MRGVRSHTWFWLPLAGDERMKAINPRTGEQDFEFVASSRAEVAAQAVHLRQSQPTWEAKTPNERAGVLLKLADAIEAATPQIVSALSVDTGRNAVSWIEMQGFIGSLRGWAVRGPQLFATLPVKTRPSVSPGVEINIRYSAHPLFGAICPWNFPILLSHIDCVPALMAGCAAMIKPSEVTPRWIAPMETVLAQFPELPLAYIKGGPDVGQALIEEVDYVCFTGSTATGRKVAQTAAKHLIPANLELGGKDPLIISASADPEWRRRLRCALAWLPPAKLVNRSSVFS